MKRILLWIAVVAIILLMIAFPIDSVNCTRASLRLCIDTIIPSIFPFLVCSGLLVYSGFCEMISPLAAPLMKPLFNVNKNGAGAFILGIVSGYPLGAVTACQLYESGYLSKYETERLLSFCNNSGPLFIMGAVGICMYSNSHAGILLYIAHILAAITTGIIFSFYKRRKHSAPDSTLRHNNKDLSHIYSIVMQNSLNSIITICGGVIFFGAISNLIVSHLPFDAYVKAVISGILEMSGGVQNISSLELALISKLTLSAVVVGFAGLCVHLQVISTVSKYNLSLFPYIFGKIFHGIISGIYTYAFLKISPITQTVFSAPQKSLSFGFFISSTLVCTSVVFFLISFGIYLFFARKKRNIHF